MGWNLQPSQFILTRVDKLPSQIQPILLPWTMTIINLTWLNPT